ncbi:hypothetical protein PR202_ga18407 [Eleusine coracana subsp. coracana]|uniref:Uncharacterized protein n=1 Tax=Eleusine coracana subsp. coracana TaxID=191504 RepID=A0AAV5CT32_ELECO|nr:hypothetical protein PR202_ga18407 [Eleusine coracana subsp. coracana]
MVTFLELTALCGNYVNFGVFELYGDRALADALDISLKMTLSVPLSDMLAFRKCASAIDSLAAFYFNNVIAGDGPPSPASVNLTRHIGEFPNLFPQMLKTLFEIILFEDAGNQWSLSRPILSLIMTSEQMFGDLRVHILASQPVDQQQRLSQCFDKLMADVNRNLEPKNRDRFTQNLTAFRHDFRPK